MLALAARTQPQPVNRVLPLTLTLQSQWREYSALSLRILDFDFGNCGDLGNDSGNFSRASLTQDNSLAMLENRNSPRRKMVLPVKVLIDRVTHLAHTVDIADTGARLGGLRTQLQPGMIVSLQRGSQKAKFRIAWIRQMAPNELQAGVECLEPQNNFWGVDLSDRDHEAKKDMQTLMTILSSSSNPAM